MAKDFDIQSPKWLDIIFEGKNKRYGAYQLRNDSSNRHIKALIIIAILGVTAIFLPRFIENVIISNRVDGTQEVAVEQTQFVTKQEKPQEKEQIEIPTTPPPVLVKSIMYTEAKVVIDSEIQKDNLAKASEALKNLKDVISVQNVEVGTNVIGQGELVENYNIIVDKQEEDDKQIYTWVQVKPSFPGGESARLKWLQDNLEYPTSAIEIGIQGLVQVGFVVEKDGSITDVKVVQSVHSALDREAVRLVKAMPKWTPGRQNGNAVRAYFTQPIRFILKQ